MPQQYKMHPEGLYFVTLSVVGWIDVFTCPAYCDLLVDNLNFCIDNKRLRVYEYVIMPSHLHMIAGVEEGNLPKALRDFKSYTAKHLLRAIAENPQENRKDWIMRLFHSFANRYQHNAEHHFWQFANRPVNLVEPESLEEKKTYILDNPVKSRLVDKSQHYVYCSAHPSQRVKLSEWD